MNEREELNALRRMAELEAKASGSSAAPEQPSYGSRVWEAYKGSVKPAAAMIAAPFLSEDSINYLKQTGALPSEQPKNFAQSINQGPTGAAAGALSSFAAPIVPLIGDAASYIAEKTGATPRMMENIQAGLNIAAPAAGASLRGALGQATVGDAAALAAKGSRQLGAGLQTAGDAIYQSGKNAAELANTKAAQDLIYEAARGKAKIDAGKLAYKEGGFMGKIGIKQTPLQEMQIKEMLSAGVNKADDPIAAMNKIRSAYSSEADNLQSSLLSNPTKYESHIADIDQLSSKQMLDNPNLIQIDVNGSDIVLNPQARVVLNKAKAIMQSNPNTPAGLLKSRQELDAWARTVKSGVFEKDSIIGDALDSVRSNMNNYIAESVPDSSVLNSLQKQSALINAEKAVAPKADAMIGSNRFSRFAEKITGSATPLTASAKLGFGLGAGVGIPVLAPSAIPLAVTGAALYGASKAIASPAVRKAIGSAISTAGDVLNPALAKALKRSGLSVQEFQKLSPDKQAFYLGVKK